LLAALLLLFTGVVISPRYRQERHAGIRAGLLAGIAYLSKQYALPFFLAALVLISGLHWMAGTTDERRRVARQLGLGLAAFALVAGPWVAVVSLKLGQPTIGTA